MTNIVSGLVGCTINGVRFNVTDSYSWMNGGITREQVKSLSGAIGHKEVPQAGEIKVSVQDTKGFTVRDFNGWSDVTVILELANGKTITGANMACTADQSVDQDATMELTFFGQTVYESR